jgi:hypothetical protein
MVRYLARQSRNLRLCHTAATGRVLDLVGKGDKPATMPLTVPVLRVLDAWVRPI